MLKLLSLLIPFIQEIFLDDPEEGDIRSRKFNLRKALPYLIVLTTTALLFFMVDRVITISINYVNLKAEKQELIKTNDEYKKEIQFLNQEKRILREDRDACLKKNQQ